MGEPKENSSNSLCVSHNVPYTVFNKFYKRIQKEAVPIEAVSIPTSSGKAKPYQTIIKNESEPTARDGTIATIEILSGYGTLLNVRYTDM